MRHCASCGPIIMVHLVYIPARKDMVYIPEFVIKILHNNYCCAVVYI